MKRGHIAIPIGVVVATLLSACVVDPVAGSLGSIPQAGASPGRTPAPGSGVGTGTVRAGKPSASPTADASEEGEAPGPEPGEGEGEGEEPSVGPGDGEAPVIGAIAFGVQRVAGTYCSTAGGDYGASCYADGDAGSALFDDPQGVAVGADGTIYVADLGNHVIRAISPDGQVGTFAGSPQESESYQSYNGVGTAAKFNQPRDVGVDQDGTLYVVEAFKIRRVSAAGEVRTIAGGEYPAGFQDGQGAEAKFGYKGGIAVTPDGTVYLADTDNDALRRIDGDGTVTTVAEGLAAPTEVVVDAAGDLYFIEAGRAAIGRLTTAGELSVLAGGKGGDETRDGRGTAATMRNPSGLAIDADGNLYFNDTRKLVSPEAQRVATVATWRRCTPDGVVSTLWRQGDADAAGNEIALDEMDGAAFGPDGSLVYTTGTTGRDVRRVVFGR